MIGDVAFRCVDFDIRKSSPRSNCAQRTSWIPLTFLSSHQARTILKSASVVQLQSHFGRSCTSVCLNAVQEPDLMRLDLQASVAALVNVQNVEAIDVELMWRAVTRN